MGFGGIDFSPIFGGSGLGSLASAFMQPNQAVPQTMYGDPSTWGGPQYAGADPSGSYGATTAVTGTPTGVGPTGPPDIGGSQSDPQTPLGTPQQVPLPQPRPAEAPSVFSTGAGPPSPLSFYGQQPGFQYPGGFADTRGTYGLPGSDTPPVTDPLTQRAAASTAYGPGAHGFAPPSWLDTAQASAGVPADTSRAAAPDIPPTEVADKPDATSQDPAPSPAPAQSKPPAQGAPAATQPPSTPQTGAAGQGGGPGAGGIGNIIGDILGIMSGNPMALGSLVQDLMRMSGGMQPGIGGQPGGGGDYPGAQGQPAPPGTNPMNYPMPPPGTRYVPGQGFVDPQGNRVSPPGETTVRSPGQRVIPGGPTDPRRVKTTNVPASGQPTTQLPAPQGGVGSAGERQPNLAAGAGNGAVAGYEEGTASAPSRQPDGSMPIGRGAVTPIIASALRAGGASNNLIQGVLFNVGNESSFDPSNVSRGDQANHPEFRGTEANNGHGLYQEGGDEWNNYTRWLNGRDWRDPQLQTQFLVANLKRNYPRLWQAMNNARTPEDAAKLFARDYLKPAPRYLMQRYNRINSGGVQRYTVPPAPSTSSVPLTG